MQILLERDSKLWGLPVCGLKSKLVIGVLQEYIQDYDIIIALPDYCKTNVEKNGNKWWYIPMILNEVYFDTIIWRQPWHSCTPWNACQCLWCRTQSGHWWLTTTKRIPAIQNLVKEQRPCHSFWKLTYWRVRSSLKNHKKPEWNKFCKCVHLAKNCSDTLALTSVQPERAFSKLRLLKTHLRSVMSNDQISSLMTLSINRDINVNTEAVIDRFARKNPRKIEFLFKRWLCPDQCIVLRNRTSSN